VEGVSSHSISTDILDENAELVHATVPPTLHRRADGVMLRWNITRGGGPYYVRVSALDLERPFSMVAVAPPVYLQMPSDPKAWPRDATERTKLTELSMSMGSAVLLDLGFSFPFFGLTYHRVWVSSAGYLAFERPPETEGFVGLDAVHSAVAVAAGQYDVARPGATLTVSRFGGTELELAWHAPLFGSSKFTDVALRLAVDGTTEVMWNRIVLDRGGSFGHKLLSQLSFNELPPLAETIVTEPIDPAALVVGPSGRASIVRRTDGIFNTTIGTFYGSGLEQGLDFFGHFVYAVNCYARIAPGELRVGDAVFTSDAETNGVTIDNSYGGYGGEFDWGSQHQPKFYGTPDDMALGTII
jgi:hypothetical protein